MLCTWKRMPAQNTEASSCAPSKEVGVHKSSSMGIDPSTLALRSRTGLAARNRPLKERPLVLLFGLLELSHPCATKRSVFWQRPHSNEQAVQQQQYFGSWSTHWETHKRTRPGPPPLDYLGSVCTREIHLQPAAICATLSTFQTLMLFRCFCAIASGSCDLKHSLTMQNRWRLT